MPSNLGEVLKGFDTILVPEINSGQLTRLIAAEYLVPSVGFNRIQGRPMRARDIENEVNRILDQEAGK